MNNKGFTLVELLAMMTVLTIIMVMVIPNISGIVKNNRESAMKEEAERAIRAAKTKFSTKTFTYPEGRNCVLLTLDDIDSNDDFINGVNDGKYDRNQSIVVVYTKEINYEYQYQFYVRLVENLKGNKHIIIRYDPNQFPRPSLESETVNNVPLLNNSSTKNEIKQYVDNNLSCNSVS